ncbi:hypothetical protein Ancab_008366 [Ancistrocladus abbreviatus]
MKPGSRICSVSLLTCGFPVTPQMEFLLSPDFWFSMWSYGRRASLLRDSHLLTGADAFSEPRGLFSAGFSASALWISRASENIPIGVSRTLLSVLDPSMFEESLDPS